MVSAADRTENARRARSRQHHHLHAKPQTPAQRSGIADDAGPENDVLDHGERDASDRLIRCAND
jgi:hypothetical protein